MMNYALDTGILGQLVHPRKKQNRPVLRWLERLLDDFGHVVQVYVPEIADYELRRKLLHLLQKGQTKQSSIDRLDDLANVLDYLPIVTSIMQKAAELWADARVSGSPTAPDSALDGDVIHSFQAFAVNATVVTSNRKHLSRFVPCQDWTEVEAEMSTW